MLLLGAVSAATMVGVDVCRPRQKGGWRQDSRIGVSEGDQDGQDYH